MFFPKEIKNFFWKKAVRIKLFLMKKTGNKRVVSEICESCGAKNYRLVPGNVIIGVFTDCGKCGEIMYFPSYQSPFKNGKAKKDFEKLVKENLH